MVELNLKQIQKRSRSIACGYTRGMASREPSPSSVHVSQEAKPKTYSSSFSPSGSRGFLPELTKTKTYERKRKGVTRPPRSGIPSTCDASDNSPYNRLVCPLLAGRGLLSPCHSQNRRLYALSEDCHTNYDSSA